MRRAIKDPPRPVPLPPKIAVVGNPYRWNGDRAFPDPHLRQIADAIHVMTCHESHTDGCGYFYDKWTDFAREAYDDRRDAYQRARKAVYDVGNWQTILKVLRAVGVLQ